MADGGSEDLQQLVEAGGVGCLSATEPQALHFASFRHAERLWTLPAACVSPPCGFREATSGRLVLHVRTSCPLADEVITRGFDSPDAMMGSLRYLKGALKAGGGVVSEPTFPSRSRP